MKDKIILVDDDLMVLESMTRFLSLDFEVASFADSESALHYAQKNDFNIVVTDQHLKDQVGIALICRMKAINENLISVIFTGYPTERLKKQISEEGIDLFYTKPIILHQFIKDLQKIAKNKTRSMYV